VTIVGCDPEAARVGDIAVEIAHSGFHTRAEVWVKARNIISRCTLRRVTPSSAEEVRSIPRVGDIWVPISMPTTNHFPRIYIPGVEDLFQTGDRVLRIEHGGSRSRLICWRIWRDAGDSWQF
jgi:hypothetical protein